VLLVLADRDAENNLHADPFGSTEQYFVQL